MVGARSLAMALNRLIDMGIDAANPRTAARELPAGLLTVGAVAGFCAGSLLVFLIAVWQLDPIVRWLWPIPVAGFVIYPYLKRFTWLCHLWLGAVDALAPVGGWVAVTRRAAVGGVGARRRGRLLGRRLRPLLLALRRRDRPRAGAALVGDAVRRARRLRRRAALHVLTVACLAAVGARPGGGRLVLARRRSPSPALLAYEHTLVRPGDLRRLDAAFFTMNGVISVAFAVFVLADAAR